MANPAAPPREDPIVAYIVNRSATDINTDVREELSATLRDAKHGILLTRAVYHIVETFQTVTGWRNVVSVEERRLDDGDDDEAPPPPHPPPIVAATSGGDAVHINGRGQVVVAKTQLVPVSISILHFVQSHLGLNKTLESATLADIMDAELRAVNSVITSIMTVRDLNTAKSPMCVRIMAKAVEDLGRAAVVVIKGAFDNVKGRIAVDMARSGRIPVPMRDMFPLHNAFVPDCRTALERMHQVFYRQSLALGLCHNGDEVFQIWTAPVMLDDVENVHPASGDILSVERARTARVRLPYASRVGKLDAVVSFFMTRDAEMRNLMLESNNTKAMDNLTKLLVGESASWFPTIYTKRNLFIFNGPNYNDTQRAEQDARRHPDRPRRVVDNEIAFMVTTVPRFGVHSAPTIYGLHEMSELRKMLTVSDIPGGEEYQPREDVFLSAVNWIGPPPKGMHMLDITTGRVEKQAHTTETVTPYTFRQAQIPNILKKIEASAIPIPTSSQPWSAELEELVMDSLKHPSLESARRIFRTQGFCDYQQPMASRGGKKRSRNGNPAPNSRNRQQQQQQQQQGSPALLYVTVAFVLVAMAWGRTQYDFGVDHIQRFLALIGASGSGKSTFTIGFLRLFYSIQQIFSMDANSFSKFSVSELMRSLIVLADDLSVNEKNGGANAQMIQRLASRAPCPSERKNVQETESSISTQNIVVTCQTPLEHQFKDSMNSKENSAQMDAFLRRWVQVPFGEAVAKKDDNVETGMKRSIMMMACVGNAFYHLMLIMCEKSHTEDKGHTDLDGCAWFPPVLMSRATATNSDLMSSLNQVVSFDGAANEYLTIQEILEGGAYSHRPGVTDNSEGFVKINGGLRSVVAASERDDDLAANLWNMLLRMASNTSDAAFEGVTLVPSPDQVNENAAAFPIMTRKVFGAMLIAPDRDDDGRQGGGAGGGGQGGQGNAYGGAR